MTATTDGSQEQTIVEKVREILGGKGMDQLLVSKWDEKKEGLKRHFTDEIERYKSCEYKDVVKAVVYHIVNDEGNYYDLDGMTVIDDGDYQGTQLFIVPADVYQPSYYNYLITYESYGSCSGCDTLMAIQEEDDKELMVSDLMTLSLHLIQNMKKLYEDE